MDQLPAFIPHHPKLSLERFLGIEGENRERHRKCQLKARHDWDAVHEWVDAYRHKPLTQRNYLKESERLLLWCIYERGKALSDLNKDDLEAYYHFLLNPTPAEKWCMPKGTQRVGRHHPEWKPFNGPLSLSSQRTAISVIHSLFNYLVEAGYLAFNPAKLIKKYAGRHVEHQAYTFKVWERVLEENEWQAIKKILSEWPANTSSQADQKAQLKFLVSILYLLGLRIREVATHSWNAFRRKNEKWWFFVKGKGDKEGMVPVTDELLDQIQVYRRRGGLSPFPSLDETELLFISLKTQKALGVRQLHRMIKNLGLKAAQEFPPGSISHQKLQKLSPHWFRHLSASHQDRAGISMQLIKANHRHASSSTTQIYVHAEENFRHQEMNKLQMRIQEPKETLDDQSKEAEEEENEIFLKILIQIKSKHPFFEKRLQIEQRVFENIENRVLQGIEFKALHDADDEEFRRSSRKLQEVGYQVKLTAEKNKKKFMEYFHKESQFEAELRQCEIKIHECAL